MGTSQEAHSSRKSKRLGQPNKEKKKPSPSGSGMFTFDGKTMKSTRMSDFFFRIRYMFNSLTFLLELIVCQNLLCNFFFLQEYTILFL